MASQESKRDLLNITLEVQAKSAGRSSQQRRFARILADIVDSLRREGMKPVPVDEARPIPLDDEASLEELREVQVNNLLRLGFYRPFKTQGITRENYPVTLSHFYPQPAEFLNRYDFPLLVDPRASISAQLGILGVSTGISLDSVRNAAGVGYRREPYQIWIDDGTKCEGQSAQECLSRYVRYARGMTVVEGLAFLREFPRSLEGRIILLPGSHFRPRHLKHPQIPALKLSDIDGDPILIALNPEGKAPNFITPLAGLVDLASISP